MARSSFGHVRERDPGRWQARYQTPDGRQHSRTFDTKEDAAKWLRDEWGKLDAGTWVDRRSGKTTFAEWAADWRRTGLVGLRPSTVARDLGYLDRYLIPAFGARRIAAIDPPAVARWVSHDMGSLAPATVHKAAQIGSKIMGDAVRARMVPANPFDGVRLPRIEREEMRFLTPAQIAELAEAIDPRYRAVVRFGAASGLRAGEMFGLRVGRVAGGTVDVAEIVTEVEGRLHVGPPKTRAGRRRVQLPASVARDVSALCAGKRASDFVFTAPTGGPVRLASWRSRFWRPACVTAGLDGVRVHDLRHTAVALWIAAGATPIEIARRAGHSSVSVVLDRYGHLLPGVEDRLTSALDDLLV